MSIQLLRDHLVYVLEGEGAHAGFEPSVADLSFELQGKRPEGLPHSAWELLEHMRIAQEDILEYTLKPGHQSPEFPRGFWPSSPQPPDDKAWARSAEAFRADIRRFADLVKDESKDLLAPLAHATGTSIMGQVLLATDHNAYHLGQIVLVRRLLGAWAG